MVIGLCTPVLLWLSLPYGYTHGQWVGFVMYTVDLLWPSGWDDST
jgi:hypothetical protein